MSRRKSLLPITLLAATLTTFAASAASPDAWAAFRRDVEASCRAAGAPMIAEPSITVDPFGSESYGIAFLAGKSVEDGSDRSLVCIYDKVTHKTEVGGDMALQKAGAPKIAADGASPASAPAEPGAAPSAAPAEAGTTAAAAAPSAAPGTASVSPGPADPAEAALADRFASFPDDPEEPAAAPEAAAQPEPDGALSPQNQPVVTPPVPILPNVPAPAQPADAERAAEGSPGDGGAAADGAAGDPADPSSLGETPAPAADASPAFAGCDAACAATLASIAETDRKALADLPFEIDRTISRNADADLAAGPGAARAAAGAIAANLTGRPSPSIALPTAALLGERSCVLYYFGYSNQAARTVARHRCAVTAGEGGGLVVAKTSGEQLRAELKPLTAGVAAFVGRTFKTGQSETRYDPANPVSAADKELGNSVGLATASEGRVMLVSSELRRFEGEDNFFWVLAIDPK